MLQKSVKTRDGRREIRSRLTAGKGLSLSGMDSFYVEDNPVGRRFAVSLDAEVLHQDAGHSG